MRAVLNFLLKSNLFAASCALALCLATESFVLNGGSTLFNSYHEFVFGGTLMAYNISFVWVILARNRQDRSRPWRDMANVHGLFLLLGLMLCLHSLEFLHPIVLFGLFVMAILSVLYVLPLLPFGTRLRDFGILKILTLTMVWTLVTAALPIFYYGQLFQDFYLEIIIRFVFMLVLCVAFDIRDMAIDGEMQIQTLPNIIGKNKSYLLIKILLFILSFLFVVQFFRHPNVARLSFELCIAAFSWWVIKWVGTRHEVRDYFLYIDGLMLLYGLCIWVIMQLSA